MCHQSGKGHEFSPTIYTRKSTEIWSKTLINQGAPLFREAPLLENLQYYTGVHYTPVWECITHEGFDQIEPFHTGLSSGSARLGQQCEQGSARILLEPLS